VGAGASSSVLKSAAAANSASAFSVAAEFMAENVSEETSERHVIGSHVMLASSNSERAIR
jgi:hypothetical protein